MIHRIDDDLASENIAWELSKAVRGDGQDDEVRMADDLRGGDRASARTSKVRAMRSAGPDPEMATS
jgi:hypothetical protein